MNELRSNAEAYRERWRAKWRPFKPCAALKRVSKTKHAQLEAERGGNLEKAAELKYGRLPELEKEIATLQARLEADDRLLDEEVTEDAIASTLAKWTGIPVAKLLAAETAKLVELEDLLRQRVVGRTTRSRSCRMRFDVVVPV